MIETEMFVAAGQKAELAWALGLVLECTEVPEWIAGHLVADCCCESSPGASSSTCPFDRSSDPQHPQSMLG